jgi:hypothetical protein
MNDNTNKTMPIIAIDDWQEPVKENPYAAHVLALINAGEGKAITVIVPAADRLKTRTQFASAANNADKTARVRVDEATDDGQWLFKFTLTNKNKPRRNKEREDKMREESAGHDYQPTNGDKPVCAVCANTERFHKHSDNPANQQEPQQSAQQEPQQEPVSAPKPRAQGKRS